MKLIDENGRLTAVGERGEICVRGFAVMRGYWDDKDKTDATIDAAGWLHSGDLGVMDEQGYLSVVGRLSDMIICGALGVYCINHKCLHVPESNSCPEMLFLDKN